MPKLAKEKGEEMVAAITDIDGVDSVRGLGLLLGVEIEKERLVKDLGEARLMILRNHGTLALGKNVAEAFTNIYFLEKACSYQVRALSGNLELNYPSEESIETTRQQGEGREMAAALLWPAVKRKMERLDSSFLN